MSGSIANDNAKYQGAARRSCVASDIAAYRATWVVGTFQSGAQLRRIDSGDRRLSILRNRLGPAPEQPNGREAHLRSSGRMLVNIRAIQAHIEVSATLIWIIICRVLWATSSALTKS